MISNYFDEPLVKNYTAPKYPLFIALQNCLNSIINKKSIRDSKSDISAFVNKIGPQGQKFVLTWLMESLDLPDFRQKANSSHRIPFLIDILKQYSSSESFLFYFPGVLAKLSKTHNLAIIIQNLCQNLKLSCPIQISIALSLYLSDRADFIEQGQLRLVAQLKQITKNNKGTQLSKKILQQLLFQISRSPELSLKLQQEYNYLLQISGKTNESDVNIYNFLKCDWQFFANQNYSTQRPNQLLVKKVDYIRQLGPYISFQPELLKNAMTQVGAFSEDDIFECLSMMTEQKSRVDNGVQRFTIQMLYQTNKKNSKAEEIKKSLSIEYPSKKTTGTWNIDNFINICNQLYGSIKWQNVFIQFDRPKLQIESQEHFLYLMKTFEKTKRGAQKWKVPQNFYTKRWNNPHSQAQFLINLFTCKDVDALFLSQVPTTKKTQKAGIKDNFLAQKQIWAHVDLVQILVQLSDYRFNQIRELFEIPTAKCPQVLLTTLSQIRPSKGQALLDEVISILLPPYLQNHSTNVKLLDTLWENNQDLIISCISQIYKSESKKQNSFNLSRVLDITQSIKESLIPFTTWNDYQFSIPLAVIAGKREFLNFEPWVVDRIQRLSNSFVRSILIYIQNFLLKHLRTIPHASHKQNILQKAQLNIDLLSKVFYTIMSKLKRQQISYRNFELLKRIFKQCCEYFPQITENQIPDEIQRETEREINRIYREEITVKQAIQRMKKLKNSAKQEEQEQFASHITFLCSEISYHHTYPEKQLMITAELFAAIINANLIDSKIYNMFLNVFQQDLKEQNQKFYFSLKVIQKIKPKLSQQPFFCQKLIDNELLMRKNPEIVEELIKNLSPPKQLSAQKQRKIRQAIKFKNAPPPQPTISVVIAPQQQNSIQNPKKTEQNDYEILVVLDTSKKIQIPDKQTKSCKINLACNTLSLNNLEEKSKDLKKTIEGDANTIKWLAYNIVFKRIPTTTQNNGIQVMYKLVQKLPMIQKPVLKITYKILQQWFALKNKSINDKKLINFKNIGAWLGKLTIGKGLPIPMHKLNIRKILIQSYNSHRLNMNVPVVLKILQNIHIHPQIFKNSSPWLSRIVGTLSQIEDKLKDQQSAAIKNEIKAFFKSNMKIDNFPIAQTSYLNMTNNNNRIIISQLDKYIKIDPDFERKYFQLKIDLKSIITRAVDDSIKEIVEPVIDRAVKIAKVTTKQLITKDFAFQPDPQRFRQSSYKLVKEMAGPLAQVTCRQPLKASMNRSLKNMLSQSITDQNQIQNIIQRAVADNLDFGCTLIKQAVVQSAQDVIKKDQTINQGIQIRFTSKVQGIPFKNDLQIQIPSIVPQQLRPRPGGLTDFQYEVYSQFKKEKDNQSPERIQQRSNAQKIIELISEKGSTKTIKQLLMNDFSSKEQIMTKIHTSLGNQANQQTQIQYYFDVCQAVKEFVDPKQCWRSFKEINDIKKKQIHRIVRKLVRQKYFPEAALNQLDKSSEEENKVVTLFQNWLQTAHQGIQPFLRNLQQMFNKSQNQIKMFFSYSLHYAMQKVSESFSEIHDSYDTNYIENYTKLIIISYKTIASNNCSLYLQHTIQSILDVFNKLQNSTSEFSYQRPFFKLFTNLICDVTRKQYDIDHEKVLTFYCVLAKQLQKIGPISCPNFTYAWVELICNKNFMPALLTKYEYWDLYYHLLSCLLKFVREYITEQNLKKENCVAYQTFYLGVLKLIVVILHDFPDFLSQFSLQLTLLAGPKFYQLNNVIISAFPKEMKFQAPIKIDKREQFVAQCKKGGIPKYYKLKFDKPRLNFFLQTDPKQQIFKDKLKAQDDESLQLLVLYTSWTSQNQINQAEATKRLTQIILYCHQQTRGRIFNSIHNLIRYPNLITLFFIDLVKDLIFNKQMRDSNVRESLLTSIFHRMNAETPQSWGQIYLARQLQIHKNQLIALNVSSRILQLL